MKKLFFIFVLMQNIGFFLQAQNTNLPVGAIPGVIDVSPMGAATYTIPIEVVPGTQGMQPNLSIVYNSFSGMGLLGMKWDLEGVSAITRCGQLPYYDTWNYNAVNFINDRYRLDGEMLISFQEPGQPTKYATEKENFMRIFPKNSFDHFIAYTDDGSIIEYGKDANSKQIMDGIAGRILSWKINKITDADGNIMTYNYWRINEGNEHLIYSIDYTGIENFRAQPYASVAFEYIPIQNDLGKNICFIGGYGVPRTQLLKAITIKHAGARVRRYVFDYQFSASDQYVHLKEVTLYGETDAIKLNSTVITWGNQSNTAVQYYGILPGINTNTHILPGDFNGDGYTDYVAYRPNHSHQLFIYNPASNEFYGFDSVTTSLSLFFKADLDGTGHDKLITAQEKQDQTGYYFFIPKKTGGIEQITINNFVQVFFGDFTGDGKTDILFMSRDNANNNIFKLYTDYMLCSNVGLTNLTGFCKVNVGDFTGNGKTDLEVLMEGGNLYKYWFNNITSTFVQYDGFPVTVNYYTPRYYGDFNGDGISDLLVYEDYIWKVSLGKGLANSYTNPIEIDSLKGSDITIITADLDGDGKDEIISFSNGSVKIIYSKGFFDGQYYCKTQNFAAVAGSNYSIKIADFNNDGTLDIYIKSSNSAPIIYQVNENRRFNCPEKITDGMGKEIRFTFSPRYLPAKDFSSATELIKKSFHFLLTELKLSNGVNGGFNVFKYQYETPAFSWSKRSFLGFRKFICMDILEDKTEENDYLFDAKQVLVPTTQITHIGYTLYTSISHTTILHSLGNRRYIPCSNPVVSNKLTGIRNETTDIINQTTGRLMERRTIVFDEFLYFRDLQKVIMIDERNYYNYLSIKLSPGNDENHAKTVINSVLNTKDYGGNGILFVDTFTYNYFPETDPNRGRLAWERRGNIHGAITTSYSNYYPSGVYGTKTVSAQGCTSRTENYIYDDTERFVTTMINPLNHTTLFEYDPHTGNKIAEIDPNGLATFYHYDSFGNLTKIIYPDDNYTTIATNWFSSTYIPNAKYSVTTKTAGKPNLTIYYDTLKREVCRLDDASYYDTRYNEKGQVVKTSYPYLKLNTSDSKKNWYEYTYDIFGRKKSEISPYNKLCYSYNFGHDDIKTRSVFIDDTLRKISTVKDYDALERIIDIQDPWGNITYKYEVTANKQHKTTVTAHDATTTILSDQWGNRLSISEPNAGEITYNYNKFNELIKMVDGRNTQTEYQYDLLGRITQKMIKIGESVPKNYIYNTFHYIYDQSVNGIGKLHKVVNNLYNGETEIFTYDNLGRLSESKKSISLQDFIFGYTYNALGQLQTLTYPSGFAVSYSYHTNGRLNTLRRVSNNSLIYKVNTRNEFNAITLCEYGNDLATAYKYNPYGLLTNIITGTKQYGADQEEAGYLKGIEPAGLPFKIIPSILNYYYDYNPIGLMTNRVEIMTKSEEKYTYDALDRLTKIVNVQDGGEQTFTYHDNGNITSNSKVGNYSYHNVKKNAVTKITLTNPNSISSNNCAVTYNFFNQPSIITEGDYRLELSYSADQQRNIVERYKKENNLYQLENRRYFVSKYYEQECIIDSALPAIIRHHHYIYGDAGAVALYVSTPNIDNNSLYYIHPDHLGSYCAITDAAKAAVQRNWFDPWGNPRDTTLADFPITNRGFTGHEHYNFFKIINMNGRLYDPVIGRFFSPDNFVQLPEFTQSFNRYSYCLNNPLKYTDPSGQMFKDVDDHYFNQHGEYLGSDNTTTDKVRIINKETWDKQGANISFIGSDGATIISQAAAHLLSRDVSEANLSDKAALNIYQHYNSTGFPLVSGDGNYQMRTQEESRTVVINLERIRQDRISDHFNEIKNLFSHERQHVLDLKSNFKNDINIMEQRAIKAQMADPTFLQTRPGFQRMVIKYGIENSMKF